MLEVGSLLVSRIETTLFLASNPKSHFYAHRIREIAEELHLRIGTTLFLIEYMENPGKIILPLSSKTRNGQDIPKQVAYVMTQNRVWLTEGFSSEEHFLDYYQILS